MHDRRMVHDACCRLLRRYYPLNVGQVAERGTSFDYVASISATEVKFMLPGVVEKPGDGWADRVFSCTCDRLRTSSETGKKESLLSSLKCAQYEQEASNLQSLHQSIDRDQ